LSILHSFEICQDSTAIDGEQPNQAPLGFGGNGKGDDPVHGHLAGDDLPDVSLDDVRLPRCQKLPRMTARDAMRINALTAAASLIHTLCIKASRETISAATLVPWECQKTAASRHKKGDRIFDPTL